MQGFVRVAVQTGASLVPVLSFGENNIFTTYRPDKRSRLAKVQRCVSRSASACVLACDAQAAGARAHAPGVRQQSRGLSAWSQDVPGPDLVSASPLSSTGAARRAASQALACSKRPLRTTACPSMRERRARARRRAPRPP